MHVKELFQMYKWVRDDKLSNTPGVMSVKLFDERFMTSKFFSRPSSFGIEPNHDRDIKCEIKTQKISKNMMVGWDRPL